MKVRDVALSLRTCDPRSARSLGVGLNAEAEQGRRALREGGGGSLDGLRMALMQAAEDLMRADRIVTEQGFVFELPGTVLDNFVSAKAAREAARPTGAMTADIERRILGRIVRDAAEKLDRKMAALRSSLTFDSGDGQDDEFVRSRDEERALAMICRLLAEKGSSARIDAQQKIDLAAKGFDPALIEHMTALLREHARNEQYRTWKVGPTYEQIVGLLTEADVEPSDLAIARLRRNGLLLLSRLLDEVDRRYDRPPVIVSAAYEDILADADAAGPGATGSQERKSTPVDETMATRPDPPSRPRTRPAESDPTPVGTINVATERPPSALALIEDLIANKISIKIDGWSPKTANQHRSAAKLRAKVAHSDNLHHINQSISEIISIFCTSFLKTMERAVRMPSAVSMKFSLVLKT